MSLSINEMAKEAYANSENHGFWNGVKPRDPSVVPLKIALIHSEASEALEVFRDHPAEGASLGEPMYLKDGKPVGFDSELADIIIRVGDLAEHLGIDLERAVEEKQAYNVKRPHMHGRRV